MVEAKVLSIKSIVQTIRGRFSDLVSGKSMLITDIWVRILHQVTFWGTIGGMRLLNLRQKIKG